MWRTAPRNGDWTPQTLVGPVPLPIGWFQQEACDTGDDDRRHYYAAGTWQPLAAKLSTSLSKPALAAALCIVAPRPRGYPLVWCLLDADIPGASAWSLSINSLRQLSGPQPNRLIGSAVHSDSDSSVAGYQHRRPSPVSMDPLVADVWGHPYQSRRAAPRIQPLTPSASTTRRGVLANLALGQNPNHRP
jgi:hypothetical protein